MIDVVGFKVEDAVQALEKEGFCVQIIEYKTDKQKKFDCDLVIRQVEKNGLIELTVSNFLVNI